MICWRLGAKLSYQFAQALPKGLMVIPLKVGFSPELLVQPLNPIGGSLWAGSLGLAPVVATASFPLINLPNFILASLS